MSRRGRRSPLDSKVKLGIPTVTTDPESLRRATTSIISAIEQLTRQRGEIGRSAVTVNDLLQLNLIPPELVNVLDPGGATYTQIGVAGLTQQAATEVASNGGASSPPVEHGHSWNDLTDIPTAFYPTSHQHPWGDISGKPATYPPDAHTHDWTELPDHTHGWSAITSKPDTATRWPVLEEITDVTLTAAAAGHFLRFDGADWLNTILAAGDIPALDAAKIATGVLDLARLPQGSLERLVLVADETARFALTTAEVQTGDTVKQLDTDIMYRVVDDTNLDNAAGYVDYVAARAAAVDWGGVENKPDFATRWADWTEVTGKPATFPPSAHAHVEADITDLGDYEPVLGNPAFDGYVLASTALGVRSWMAFDHGALAGLGDDDHTQYHTDARGDARYSLLAHNHDADYAALAHNHDAAYAALGHDHDLTYAALVHDHDADYAALGHDHAGVYEPVLGNPASDGYVLSSTAAGVRSWVAPGGGGGAWGTITGTLSDQTDLQSALDLKADIADILIDWSSTPGDLDTIDDPAEDGFYGWTSPAPTNAPWTYGGMIAHSGSFQTVQLAFGGSSGTRLASRRRTSGVWDAWREYAGLDDLAALDADVVKLAGDQTVAGVKEFTSLVPAALAGRGALFLDGTLTGTAGDTNRLQFGSASELGISGAIQWDFGFLVNTGGNPRNFYFKASTGTVKLVTDYVDAAVSVTEAGTALASKYAALSHTHSYLPLAGGDVMTGRIGWTGTQTQGVQGLARGTFTSADLMSSYPDYTRTGQFVENTESSFGVYGYFDTIKMYNNTAGVQYFYPYNFGANPDYPIRYRLSDYSLGWQAWRSIASQEWVNAGFLALSGGQLTGNVGYTTLTGPNTSDRDKLRVYGSGIYTIGMQSGVGFGALNFDWAMTFQMSDSTPNRGWWWGDAGHTQSQGAMSLSTGGMLSVAARMRIGYGEADTTVPSASFVIDADGPIKGGVPIQLLNSSTTLSSATYQDNLIYNTTSGITFTLSNSVPIGTQWQFHNRSTGNITIATGGNTVYWFDGGGAAPGTGNRTLARAGVATVVKIASAVFHIYGAGLS